MELFMENYEKMMITSEFEDETYEFED